MLRGEGEEWRSRNEWGKHRGPKARNDEVFEGSSRYRSVLTRDRSLSISHSLALPLAHPPHAPSPSTYPQPPIQSNPILLSPIYYFDPHLNLLSRFWIRFGTALIQCCVRSFASLLACLAPPRPYLAPHRRCFARLLPNSAMPPPLRRQRQAPLPAARRTGASECSDSHASTRRTSSSSSTPHRPRPPIWPHNSFATMASGARSRSNSRYRRLYSLFSSIILLRVLSCFPSNFYRVPVIEQATRWLDLHHARDDYDGNHHNDTHVLLRAWWYRLSSRKTRSSVPRSSNFNHRRRSSRRTPRSTRSSRPAAPSSRRPRPVYVAHSIIRSIAIRSNVLDRELRLIETRSFVCLSRVVGDGRHRDLEHRVQGSRDGQEGHRDHCQ